ncbi:uncharacterized protein LOC131160888 [Malania oleifera]|uniref:uncharacterized protein LOC131160888 n=1 Tax=Malania oleifera TaxID=397392 RepID=UPI0025ADF315|nr:uncharacterized protein LOC131160888 [Malania oleifera]
MKKDTRGQNCPPAGQGYNIKEFMRMNPLAFVGGPDLVAAENWVLEIEEIMVVLDCTDEQKVCYAAFKMIGDAKYWYFLLSIREEKIEEFTNLNHGNMTIGEYASKFVELSCFAQFLIPNEARKARKFEKGLKCKIYELVVGFYVQTFSDLVDKASVLEKSIQEYKAYRVEEEACTIHFSG